MALSLPFLHSMGDGGMLVPLVWTCVVIALVLAAKLGTREAHREVRA